MSENILIKFFLTILKLKKTLLISWFIQKDLVCEMVFVESSSRVNLSNRIVCDGDGL